MVKVTDIVSDPPTVTQICRQKLADCEARIDVGGVRRGGGEEEEMEEEDSPAGGGGARGGGRGSARGEGGACWG